MENQRFFLYISLLLVLYLLWNSWTRENLPPQEYQSIEQQVATTNTEANSNDVPQSAESSSPSKLSAPTTEVITDANEYVVVETDVFKIYINTRGADIHRAELKTYPVNLEQPDIPLILLDDSSKTYISQSGLLHDRIANVNVSKLAPNHHDVFQTQQSKYVLSEGQDELVVPFQWRGDNNVLVTKTFIFQRNKYLVDVAFKIDNQGQQDWIGRQYRQLRHSYVSGERSWLRLPTYTGSAYYDEKYEKLSFDDMLEEPLNKEVKGGWTAMLQHYFFSAWLADEFEVNDFYTNVVDNPVGSDYIIGLRSEPARVATNSSAEFNSRLYIGPKLQKRIEEIQPGLELTTDYGMFTPLCKPLFWVLDFVHQGVKNWGWSIIIVTLLIKLVFYRLSASSYRSMARMRNVQPKMVSLRERYGDDKQKLNQAMWELYKKEKINPLGGCLPILIQMPVFLSLYWVLIESVEMRHAPFMLWIQDLSSKDPLFILPLLMGISMFIQFKLNPKPPDPMQEKIFMIMPIFMTAFMAFFPAGLVLYWFVNNLLSIAQQWYITKRFATT